MLLPYIQGVGKQIIIFCFYFVHTKPPDLGANTCNSKSPIVSTQSCVWVHLFVSCSVSCGEKKLPSSPVSMPTIINVGYFMGRAGELLVLGNGPDRSSRSHRAEVLYPSVSSSLGRRRSRHGLIFTARPLPGQVGAATRRTGEQLLM